MRPILLLAAVVVVALAAIPSALGDAPVLQATTQTDFLLCPSGPPGSSEGDFGPAPDGCQYGGATFQDPSPVTFCPGSDVHAWVHANIWAIEPPVTLPAVGAGVEGGYFQVTVTGPSTNIVQQVYIPLTQPDPSPPVGYFDLGTLAPGTYTVLSEWLGSSFSIIENGDPATLDELPSSATDTLTILPACLGSSAFVVGDESAGPGSAVTFWGSQWAKQNALSGGKAPASFKGFADSVTTSPDAACGGTWTARTGNSSQPPAAVGAYVAVIVASSVSQHGSTISGDIEHVLIVQTNSGYGPNPGHAGTGVVVGEIC
jgi:hypothetical protein